MYYVILDGEFSYQACGQHVAEGEVGVLHVVVNSSTTVQFQM